MMKKTSQEYSSIKEYFGRSGGLIFSIRKSSQGISLSKVYGKVENKCSVYWNFNVNGRIFSMCIRDLCEHHSTKLLEVRCSNTNWTAGSAKVMPLPQRTQALTFLIGHKAYPQKYETLLSTGHEFAYEICSNIANNKIFILEQNIRPGQLPLAEIKNDSESCLMLWNAGSIAPKIMQSQKGLLISYTKREKIDISYEGAFFSSQSNLMQRELLLLGNENLQYRKL